MRTSDQEGRFISACSVFARHKKIPQITNKSTLWVQVTLTKSGGPAAISCWGSHRLAEMGGFEVADLAKRETSLPWGLYSSLIQLRHSLIPSTWITERHNNGHSNCYNVHLASISISWFMNTAVAFTSSEVSWRLECTSMPCDLALQLRTYRE